MSNFYEILNCDVDASLEEIRNNYKELILKHHPDKLRVSDSRQFCAIQEAWKVLSDESKRKLFDDELFWRNSDPILYGTFKIEDFHHDISSKKYVHSCRCGGYFYLNEDELKFIQSFRVLHLPCENCSLMVQLEFEDSSYHGKYVNFGKYHFLYQFFYFQDAKIKDCNCDRKCFLRVPEDVRKNIYDTYNQMPNNDIKNLYLYGLMCKVNEKSGAPNSRSSYRYFVKINGFQVDICVKAFINIHGITYAKLRTLTTKLDEGVIYPCDGRGKARTLDKSDKLIVDHLTQVLQQEEILDQLRRGEKVNITKMWEDYKIFCVNNFSPDVMEDLTNESAGKIRTHVCLSKYNQVFKTVFPEILLKFLNE